MHFSFIKLFIIWVYMILFCILKSFSLFEELALEIEPSFFTIFYKSLMAED
jgi:hypothetical protein